MSGKQCRTDETLHSMVSHLGLHCFLSIRIYTVNMVVARKFSHQMKCFDKCNYDLYCEVYKCSN